MEPKILQVFRRIQEGESALKAIREAAGLTQQELAVRLDTTVTTISRWENGRSGVTLTIPQIKALQELLNEIGVPLSSLPDDLGPKKTS